MLLHGFEPGSSGVQSDLSANCATALVMFHKLLL